MFVNDLEHTKPLQKATTDQNAENSRSCHPALSTTPSLPLRLGECPEDQEERFQEPENQGGCWEIASSKQNRGAVPTRFQHEGDLNKAWAGTAPAGEAVFLLSMCPPQGHPQLYFMLFPRFQSHILFLVHLLLHMAGFEVFVSLLHSHIFFFCEFLR